MGIMRYLNYNSGQLKLKWSENSIERKNTTGVAVRLTVAEYSDE